MNKLKIMVRENWRSNQEWAIKKNGQC